MSAVTLLGLIAGLCTTVAFVPQVVKTWRTRSTKDISLPTFALFAAGVGLWLAYGLLIEDVAIMAANAVTFGLAGTVLALKLRHG